MNSQNLISMRDFSEINKYNFTFSELQNIFAERNHNGLKEHLVIFGRRIFVNVSGFEKWYKSEKKLEKSIE